MKSNFLRARSRNKQSGYALLIVVCLTALLLVATMSIGLRVLTEGRREKEQEMIWRGKQYTRGVKLYYQKLGRFPNSMDDLVKPKIGNLRFMRQAYKDPMNKEDGSWRLIYVGPSGQLIGSLKLQQTGIQMPVAGGQPGASGSSTSSGFGFGTQQGTSGGISPTGATPGASGTGTSTGTNNGTNTTGTGTGAQGTDGSGTATGTGTDQPIPTGDTPTIVGGNIIGVGSKVNQASIIVYDKAKNYRLFEFIWDPSKGVGVASPGANVGTPAGTQPGTPGGTGQNPNGSPNPMNPPPTPPTATPNPSQP